MQNYKPKMLNCITKLKSLIAEVIEIEFLKNKGKMDLWKFNNRMKLCKIKLLIRQGILVRELKKINIGIDRCFIRYIKVNQQQP